MLSATYFIYYTLERYQLTQPLYIVEERTLNSIVSLKGRPSWLFITHGSSGIFELRTNEVHNTFHAINFHLRQVD